MICLNPPHSGIFITFFNNDDKDDAMVAQVKISSHWRKDYWLYAICDAKSVTVFPNNYQTLRFNISIGKYVKDAFGRLDAGIFNVGEESTVLCIAISFVIMCIFLCVGFKGYDDEKPIAAIYWMFLLFVGLYVITWTMTYFFHIYVIGFGCSRETVVQSLFMQLVDENIIVLWFSLVIILELGFMLRIVSFAETKRVSCCCVWLLTSIIVLDMIYVGLSFSNELVGIIDNNCTYGFESCNQYYYSINSLTTDIYGLLVALTIYFLVVWIETKIMHKEQSTKCYLGLLVLMLLCLVCSVVYALIDLSEFPTILWHSHDSPVRKQRYNDAQQVVRMAAYGVILIWGIRACSMISIIFVISKYFIIGWYFILTIWYMEYVEDVLYDARYTPLMIIGAFIIVLVFFYDSKNNSFKIVFVIIGIFLQLMDVTTDWNLIYQWYNNGHQIWAVIQIMVMLLAQIISALKMGNVDNILADYNNRKNSTISAGNGIRSNNEHYTKVKFNKCDKIMTSIGFGK